MVPQLVAVTLLRVSQVTVQVTAVLLFPVTEPVNCWVRLVMTLAEVGVTEMLTVEEALLPQPSAASPSAAARMNIVDNFHQLIPILPSSLDRRPYYASFSPCRLPGLPICAQHILNSALPHPQLKRPAHREPERAYRIEEIRPLRV